MTTETEVLTNNSDGLLPCPFCGGSAIAHAERQKNRLYYIAYCGTLTGDDDSACPCPPCTDEYSTKEKAIAAWNTRADSYVSGYAAGINAGLKEAENVKTPFPDWI